MARRSDHSRAELMALALDAAREIVAREGFRGLTARRVAQRIGYSVGTLYNVFENLDDLIVHLDAGLLDRLYAAVTDGPPHADIETALKALAGRYIAFVETNRNEWELMFEHKLPPGQDLPEWYYTKLHRLLALVEDTLAPLFGAGEAAARARAARVLWAGVHGIATLAGTGKLAIITAEGAGELIDTLIETYVAGMRASSSSAQ
jgi:AcrR family transcriptional regulator